jgi:hypothetical protein
MRMRQSWDAGERELTTSLDFGGHRWRGRLTTSAHRIDPVPARPTARLLIVGRFLPLATRAAHRAGHRVDAPHHGGRGAEPAELQPPASVTIPGGPPQPGRGGPSSRPLRVESTRPLGGAALVRGMHARPTTTALPVPSGL